MTELTKETITTQNSVPVETSAKSDQATSYQTIEYLMYFLFGVLEVLLVFRLILRLTGANSFSAFVGLIYSVTGVFIAPFQGIIQQATAPGVVKTAVLEPATLVAIVVYAAIAVGIVKFTRILSGKKQQAN
jgi:hypothetical protein